MNDLAVYAHLGSVAAKRDYSNAAQLVEAVMDAWESMPPALLERIAAVKCMVMRELISSRGKVVKIPHSKLTQAQQLGCLWELVDELCSQVS